MATARTLTRKPRRRRTAPVHEDAESPSIWREALWGLDWLSLRLSPVYLGLGVPHGDGSPVVLVPGFLTTDAYLVEMYFWLRRVGYSPYLSGIGVNADCIQVLTRRLERTIESASKETGKPVNVIGHSLGGLLARRAALESPDRITQLISLGSPINSLEAHPALTATARWVTSHVRHARFEGRERTPTFHLRDDCECAADHCVLSPPPSIKRTALYSKTDGVVGWRNCLEPDPSCNFEVGGTHIGLVFNARAYRVIASVLAGEADGAGLRAA